MFQDSKKPHKQFSNAIIVLGVLLALGLMSAAFVLGLQAKRAVTAQLTADSAVWSITVGLAALTQADALQAIAQERKAVEYFLTKQGLNGETWAVDLETISTHYEEIFIKDTLSQVQKGFDDYQTIRISTKELTKFIAANKAFFQLNADSHPLTAQPPNYLVSDLETVRMSLIEDATENVSSRATEIVSNMVTKWV